MIDEALSTCENDMKMIHDLISTHVFSWLNLPDIATIARSSRDGLRLIQSLLSVGLVEESSAAFHNVQVTKFLCEKINNLNLLSKCNDDSQLFVRNVLKPALNLISTKHDVMPRIMKKIFHLCPNLHSMNIAHPTTAILKRIKPLNLLRHMTLGQTGFSNIKCSDESFVGMLSLIGNQLTELKVQKLNCLTIKSIEGISQYCRHLEKLSVVSCNGVRATSAPGVVEDESQKSTSNCNAISRLIRAVGPKVEEIDLRYSLEMDDGYLQEIIENADSKKFRVFLASRTISSRRSELYLKVPVAIACGFPFSEQGIEKMIIMDKRNLTNEKWSDFVNNFSNSSTLLYIDNIGNEGAGEVAFLYKKSHSARSEGSFQVAVPLDDNLFKTKKRAAPLRPVAAALCAKPAIDWASCLQCDVKSAFQECNNAEKGSNAERAKFATSYSACATDLQFRYGVDGGVDLQLSDGGFADDAETREVHDSVFTEEGFIDEIEAGSEDMQEKDPIEYDSGTNCVSCIFLPVPLTLASVSSLNRKYSFNVSANDAKDSKQKGHIPKNLTFIRFN